MRSERRVWNQTSASQHDAFQRCQRYWFYGWIERVPRETSLPQQRGKDIHTEVEHHLKTGEFRESRYSEHDLNYRPYVEAIAPYLPPNDRDLIIEQRIWIETGLGVGWLGFIDIGHSGSEPLILRDIKSTSDFRYCKTPEELSENIQLVSYAEWVFRLGHPGEIDAGLIYVKTEKKVVRKKPKTKLVQIRFDREHVGGVWDREMATVAQMKEIAATCESAHELPPTVSACSMFGGCPFREKCGLTGTETLASMFKKEGKAGMGFLKNLKKDETKTKKDETKKNGTSAKATAAAVAEVAKKKVFGAKKKTNTAKPPADGQTLSDDAPSREVEETDEPIVAEPETKKKSTTRKKKAATNGATKNGFTIYVDCYPSKDVNRDGVDPTMFEDWFGPLVMSMNEYAKEKKDLPHYLLLGFSDEKALVALSVQDAIERGLLPPALVINSGAPNAKDVLGHLVPHASVVVRASR